MINVTYDSKHNTIIVELAGKIDLAQGEQLYSAIQKSVPKDGKGFKILTDLTGIETVDPKIKGSIQKLMEFCDKQGVTEVLRAIADPSQDIGLNIMSLFHYSKKVTILTFQSREEAQAHLG